jgi:hypothetical protein
VSYEANPRLKPVIEANSALNPAHPELRMRAIPSGSALVTFHKSDIVVSSSLYQRTKTHTSVMVESVALGAAHDRLAFRTVDGQVRERWRHGRQGAT